MPAIIKMALRLTGVTFTELKDNPSIRAEFVTAVKAGILQASNLNNTNEIDLTMSAGSIRIEATITPPAGMEHTYSLLARRGITEVATLVSEKVAAVPNIDSVGTGVITVTITQKPEMSLLPISSFNVDFGQEAVERDYNDLGSGQCRLKNEQMKIPASAMFSDRSNDCRRLCNERNDCAGFTANAVFEKTVDKDTGLEGHTGTDGTGPCILWMQRELGADGYDDYDGNCYVKKAVCSDDLICPETSCAQCKATNDGLNKPTDPEEAARRTCIAEICDPDLDSDTCCNVLEDETDGAEVTTAPMAPLFVLSLAALLRHLF
jgi:hypothetical protein